MGGGIFSNAVFLLYYLSLRGEKELKRFLTPFLIPSRAWTAFNVTVEEGLDHLKTLCAIDLQVNGGGSCLRIPRPRKQSVKLLQALSIRLPEALPNPQVRVVTRKKLPERRKSP